MRYPRILDILEEVLVEEQKEKKEKYKNYEFHHNPSSATFLNKDGKVVGACLRQLYYRATKAVESDPMDMVGMMQTGFGDAIHQWLSGKLRKSKKIIFKDEVSGKVKFDPLTKEISYRVDGLVTFNGEQGGAEFKTVQSRAITGKDFGIKTKGPKEDHLAQIATYLSVEPHLKWFSLVYIARDTAYPLEFLVTKEDNRTLKVGGKRVNFDFSDVTKRWNQLETYIKNVEAPPRDYKVWLKDDGTVQETKQINGDLHRSDFRCLYCPYMKYCWSQEDALNAAYRAEDFR